MGGSTVTESVPFKCAWMSSRRLCRGATWQALFGLTQGVVRARLHAGWQGAAAAYLGLMPLPEMVAAANQSLEFESHSDRLSFVRVSTLARLALDDGSLDGILCSSVLEYLPDPRACLTEFARVLKPRGLLLVSVPNRDSIARRLQLACHHLGGLLGQSWCKFLNYSRHQYSPAEFNRLLIHTGFADEKVVPFGGPLPRLAQRSRHWAPLLMFVAQKLA